jgi:hypothetical protein
MRYAKRPEIPPRSCKFCGHQFRPAFKNKIFCCRPCGLNYHHQRRKLGTPEPRNCLRCGRQYQPAKRNSRFCSKECQQRVIICLRPCLFCGQHWCPKRSDAIYCSRRCKNKARSL